MANGCLYVLATPIGNLADISNRALDILGECDWIACEDTRVTGKLLRALELPAKRLISCHDHNEAQRSGELVQKLLAGETGCLTSDAGTPTLGDPGFRLVRACRQSGIAVLPIPGPFAAAAALSVSGLPTDRFLFMGFPPPKGAARRTLFEKFRDFPHTLVFYESTHRIHKCVADAELCLGAERMAFLGREITKLHETHYCGTLAQIHSSITGKPMKGEMVLVIAPAGFQL